MKNGSENGKSALKKLGVLLLNFVLLYTLLRLIIALSERTQNIWIYYIGTGAYALAGCALFIAFFVYNGFTFDNKERTWDDLPNDWNDNKKSSFLAAQTEKRKKAKMLLYIIFPLIVSAIVSWAELNFFS